MAGIESSATSEGGDLWKQRGGTRIPTAVGVPGPFLVSPRLINPPVGLLTSLPVFLGCTSASQRREDLSSISPGRREVSWLQGSEFSASVFISFGGKTTLSGRFRILDSAVPAAGAEAGDSKQSVWFLRKDSACVREWQDAGIEPQKCHCHY